MAQELLLCLNQGDINTPYTFELTNINVYSFEEALFHTYNYWQESIEDIKSGEFINWVKNELGLVFIAKEIEKLREVENLSERLISFLSLTNYFDGAQLSILQVELMEWEEQNEWERLKDMGDYLIKRNEPEKAINYYKKALDYGDNIGIYNNLGITYMYLEEYNKASEHIGKAYKMDKDSFTLLINYAESLIYSGDYETAFKYLRKAERDNESDIVFYLYGKLCYESGNPEEAINYYNKALKLGYEPRYYYELANCYIRLRKYNEALEIIENVKDRNVDFYINQAKIHSSFLDYGAAIKSLERAVVLTDKESPELWTSMAKYHRLNYDLFKAEGAIVKALDIDKNYKKALFEQAQIKKAQGKTRDYQEGLVNILDDFKNDYRNVVDR